jgi:hypothetical protein
VAVFEVDKNKEKVLLIGVSAMISEYYFYKANEKRPI